MIINQWSTTLKQTLRSFLRNQATILNMNRRNLEYIYPNNARHDFPIADNKLNTKLYLAHTEISMPETYQVYNHFFQLRSLEKDLSNYQQFVIKPASGSGGGGIIVINSRVDNGFLSINGNFYSLMDIHKHIADILFGIYSFGLHDQAMIEAKIQQHPDINILSPKGLADVRIIVCQQQPIQAMIRLATKQSNGTANLHQGAIGVGIDINSGVSINACFKNHFIRQHPDTNQNLIGFSIPYWNDVMNTAKRIAQNIPLNYIGADIAISDNGPCLLEINVRPGIEIQNANAQGMRGILESKMQKSKSNGTAS